MHYKNYINLISKERWLYNHRSFTYPILSIHQWLMSATYYDKKFNVVQVTSQLYSSRLERVYSQHDFFVNITRVKVNQTISNKSFEYDKYMTYDRHYRLSKIKQQIKGDVLVSVAKYEYDDLFRISKKKILNEIDATTYDYAIDSKFINSTSPLFLRIRL